MKKGYIVLKPLRHNGQSYRKGSFMEQKDINDDHAKRLLVMQVIEPAYREEAAEVAKDDSPEIVPVVTTEEETIEEMLDINFNTSELKEGAEKQGLNFAKNISKAKLIELIVVNQKADYFLEQLED